MHTEGFCALDGEIVEALCCSEAVFVLDAERVWLVEGWKPRWYVAITDMQV